MYFESVTAALQMDGHGGFVWSAYAIAVLVVGGLLVLPRLRQKRLLRELRGEMRRRERQQGGS